MNHPRRFLLWFAVTSALCLQSGCRRGTPTSLRDLQSDPRAWDGKRVVVCGASSGACFPELWSESPGFQLTDSTGRDISVLTAGAIPAEGRWVTVEGVVLAHEYNVLSEGPCFTVYRPVIVVSSPWNELRKHLAEFLDGLQLRKHLAELIDGLQLRLIELTERSRLLQRIFELAASPRGVRGRGHSLGRRTTPTYHPRVPQPDPVRVSRRMIPSERNRVGSITVDGMPVAPGDTVRVVGGRSHRISWRGICADGCKPMRLSIAVRAGYNGEFIDLANSCPSGYYDYTFPVSKALFWLTPRVDFTDYTYAWEGFFVTSSERP
jgi:hypothetical protein